jgi:hypothetical protein
MQQPIPVVEKAVTIHVLLAGQEVGALGASPSVGTDHALSSKSWPATTPRIPPLVDAAVGAAHSIGGAVAVTSVAGGEWLVDCGADFRSARMAWALEFASAAQPPA